jgi:predicted nuclease of predicted toxin-antitoxin system
MEMPNRYLNILCHLDTNHINARQNDQYVNQLEEWNRNGVIEIEISYTVDCEARQGKGGEARNAKADDYVWVSTNDSIGGEEQFRKTIEQILFPDGAYNRNQKNDVEILFTAFRANAILITNDGDSKTQRGGILGNANSLSCLGIKVLSAQKAVNEIKRLIKDRDDKAIKVSKFTGKPLPDWVGKD